MKAYLTMLITALVLALAPFVTAQTPSGTPQPGSAELEAKFIAAFTNATLSGRWCGIKDGQLGPDKVDSYAVVSVKKLEGDHWQINAQMSYGGNSVEVPIPVQVKWAGDTPVLILDKVSMGGPRTYSARVLIYENTYAGTWNAGDHGGLLNGIITHGKN